MNVLEKMDAYWDSDECRLSELRELTYDRLKLLQACDRFCLYAMEKEGEKYWEWREKQPMFYTPRNKKPLWVVEEITRRSLRLVEQVLDERRKG